MSCALSHRKQVSSIIPNAWLLFPLFLHLHPSKSDCCIPYPTGVDRRDALRLAELEAELSSLKGQRDELATRVDKEISEVREERAKTRYGCLVIHPLPCWEALPAGGLGINA